jgi:predicted nucleic acid-binding protein
MQVLRRFERAGVVTGDRALEALDDLQSLRLVYHDHTGFLGRVWSMRQNLTAYDALYVALAEALDAPLVTTDRKLGGAPVSGVRVLLIGFA